MNYKEPKACFIDDDNTQYWSEPVKSPWTEIEEEQRRECKINAVNTNVLNHYTLWIKTFSKIMAFSLSN